MSSRQAGRSCPARLRCGASLPTCRAGDRGFEAAWMPEPDPRTQGFLLESGAGSSAAGPAGASSPSSWPCRLLSPSARCWPPSLASAAAAATALAQPHSSRQRRARGRARAACAGASARTWRCSGCEPNVEVFSLTAWDERPGCTFLCWAPSSRRTLFSPTATPWAWARCAASMDTSASARATASSATTRATVSARASPQN